MSINKTGKKTVRDSALAIFAVCMAMSSASGEIILRAPAPQQEGVATDNPAIPAAASSAGHPGGVVEGAAVTGHSENISVPTRETSQTKRLILNLSRLAATGDVSASLRLGYLYYQGKDTARSYTEAYQHFREAANRGSAPGMLGAGYLMAFGYGTPRDPNGARAYFTVAEKAGFARGAYLQSLLEGSVNTPQARMRAKQLLERAVSSGDGVAANVMANGYFQTGQTETARLWYGKAMDMGSPAAGRNIERIAQLSGQKERAGVALETLRRDSAAGRGDASYELAVRYHRGVGVGVDFGQALRFYRLAARQGSAPADQMLSLILSRSTPAKPINAEWMQELSRTMRTPAISTDGAGLSMEVDDPLEGLMNLSAKRVVY